MEQRPPDDGDSEDPPPEPSNEPADTHAQEEAMGRQWLEDAQKLDGYSADYKPLIDRLLSGNIDLSMFGRLQSWRYVQDMNTGEFKDDIVTQLKTLGKIFPG
jgi:hypothetical protein